VEGEVAGAVEEAATGVEAGATLAAVAEGVAAILDKK
jgi:hypothetical protein